MFGEAEAYDRFMGRWIRLVAPLLIEFAGSDNLGEVLDVGSGTGSLAFAILKLTRNRSVDWRQSMSVAPWHLLPNQGA